MNKLQLAQKINIPDDYSGSLTRYAVRSIAEGRSNYPVSNLITCCSDLNVQFVLTDMLTDEHYDIDSVMDAHRAVCFLMERYSVDSKLIYRKTGIHYTCPKSLDEDFIADQIAKGQKHPAPLSIDTLLAVCSVLRCRLDFVNRQ